MSHPIFNSLGSNYSWNFVRLALKNIFFCDKSAQARLISRLNEKFHGQTFLFYKGRDAIEFSLRAYGIGSIPEDTVLTQAFSCHAIEEAIIKAGAKPFFVDLKDGQLNPSLDTVQYAFRRAQALSVA